MPHAAAALHRRTVLSALLAFAATPPRAAAPAPSPAVTAVQHEVESLVALFMARARALLPGVAAPRVVVSFTPQLSWIEDDGSATHTVEWSQCPPGVPGFFASLLGDRAGMPAPSCSSTRCSTSSSCRTRCRTSSMRGAAS